MLARLLALVALYLLPPPLVAAAAAALTDLPETTPSPCRRATESANRRGRVGTSLDVPRMELHPDTPTARIAADIAGPA